MRLGRWPLVATVIWLSGAAIAQSRPSDPIAKTRAAVLAWLDSNMDERVRDRVTSAIRAERRPAIHHLAERIKALEPGSRESKALDALVVRVAVVWLDVIAESRFVHAGQYQELAPLQPRVGEVYLELLLNTPQWFSYEERIRVVPAVRDLFPTAPSRQAVQKMREIADDEAREPLALRSALWWALAQWGDRELARRHLKQLESQRDEENADLRLIAEQRLADAHYQMRDYQSATLAHRRYLVLAKKVSHPIAPIHYYNAACCASLAGDRRSALGLLEDCLRLNSSEHLDDSWRIKRSVFEQDPEIGAIRSSQGFQTMLARAFDGSTSKPTKDR